MLCLSDSIRDDDPCVQRLLCTLEEAHTLPELMLAAWALARGLARHLIASVLAERARRPASWAPPVAAPGRTVSPGGRDTTVSKSVIRNLHHVNHALFPSRPAN